MMALELSTLMQLALGQRGPVTVGDLPLPVAEYLGCHPAIVFLGKESLEKIVLKHREVQRWELLELSIFLEKGCYVTDAKRRDCVSVFGRSATGQNLYLTGLKATAKGCEVWVSTFHRSNDAQHAKHVRKGRILRDFKR